MTSRESCEFQAVYTDRVSCSRFDLSVVWWRPVQCAAPVRSSEQCNLLPHSNKQRHCQADILHPARESGQRGAPSHPPLSRLALQHTNTRDRVFFSRRPEAPPGRQASRTARVWPWRGLGKPPSLPPAFLFLGVSSGPAYVLHSRYVISGSWTIGYGCSVHLLKYVPIVII